MARSGRSGRSFGRRGRTPKDWVVNQYTYNYTDPNVITPLPAGQVALPLTFSDQVRTIDFSGDEFTHSWAAIPEGMGLRTYAVRGHIIVEPESYNAGQGFDLAVRIAVHDQSFETMQAIVPATYSLLDTGASAAYVYADEPFCWQRIYAFRAGAGGAGTARWALPINATCNRRLEKNQALYIIFETGVGSVSLNVHCLVRTLCGIRDDN